MVPFCPQSPQAFGAFQNWWKHYFNATFSKDLDFIIGTLNTPAHIISSTSPTSHSLKKKSLDHFSSVRQSVANPFKKSAIAIPHQQSPSLGTRKSSRQKASPGFSKAKKGKGQAYTVPTIVSSHEEPQIDEGLFVETKSPFEVSDYAKAPSTEFSTASGKSKEVLKKYSKSKQPTIHPTSEKKRKNLDEILVKKMSNKKKSKATMEESSSASGESDHHTTDESLHSTFNDLILICLIFLLLLLCPW